MASLIAQKHTVSRNRHEVMINFVLMDDYNRPILAILCNIVAAKVHRIGRNFEQVLNPHNSRIKDLSSLVNLE